MRVAILGFVAGAGCLQLQPAIPAMHWLLAATVLVLTLTLTLTLALSASRRPPAIRGPCWRGLHVLLLTVASLALGISWAAQQAHRVLGPSLAVRDEGRDITLVGTIDNLPYVFDQGVRFNFAVERVLAGAGQQAARVPPRIALSWYRPLRPARSLGSGAVGDVQPGERWQLTVRLQRPHGNLNPYGFDYEAWLLEQGLRATGYVRPAPSNLRLDNFVLSFGNLVEHCRAALRARILRTLPGKEYAGVIVALVVGDQRGIDQSDWQVFNRTGIGHLISISGLHITMVAGMAALAASSLWRRSLFTRWQLPLLLPAQKVAALAGTAVALLYVLLAGFGVPAQRTLYMLAVIACALWSGRIARVSHVLCWALGTVVLLDPWAVLWPGFWLSFGAVAMILYASVGRTAARPVSRRHRAAQTLPSSQAPGGTAPPMPPPVSRRQLWWLALKLGAHTQYVVTLGLVPLTMLLFAQVSLVSPLANAVAIPLISLVVTPLSLAGSLLPAPLSLAGSLLPAPLAWPLLSLAHLLVQALAACLRSFSSWPAAVWSAPMPPWWLFCWAMFGTCWMLAPRGWPQRWLGLLTWLPLLTAQPARPETGHMQVVAFDVGQGMAVLVQTAHHMLLYDSGPGYGPGADAGNRVILPYLKARGIAALDLLVISHSDADHAGGVLTLLQGVSVGSLLSSLPAGHPAVLAAPLSRHCAAGQAWNWDGVQIAVLHPLPGSYGDAALKPNSRSCVLKISTASRAMLLAGDIEAGDEAALLGRAAPLLASDVLLAPHHGSGTSSTPAFLAAVHPSLALFQVGYRNRYHHPRTEVYQRYGKLGITRLRTDETGALVLDIGDQVTVSAWRVDHGRYWNAR